MILADKILVISGVGPGLGREMALLGAKEGASLVLAARSRDRLDAVKAEVMVQTPGARVLCQPADIQQRGDCQALVAATLAEFGRLDVLINSAYTTGPDALAAEADLDVWRQTLEVNLFGTLQLIQETVPAMKAAGGGSIVNVNTKVARMALAGMGGYAVSKAALRMATTQLAKELGEYRIRVNSIFPGWMWGDTVISGLQPVADAQGIGLAELRAKIARDIPLGDIPTDGECAKGVLALASDYFSATTGACLDLSGGEYMPL